MGRETSSRAESTRRAASITGAVEAMLYVVIFALALVFVVVVLGAAASEAHEGASLERAIEAAGEAAERFSADPASTQGVTEIASLKVVVATDEQARSAGTMHIARIIVYEGDDVVYERDAYAYRSYGVEGSA